ncbi:outer membrane beta-barrel protein [Algoriphagus halophytocola]|uniref:Outer membrane beta-barrel protein n=1 Tax=Algoriphagus halophytocola TaxID=2991499 RepID=A0ABY6MIS8_9BACT|nr:MULTISPECIES: outer membrane beta-barrel protein [unclassified Algoriphagus]UZD22945.1 outer membrane beta-barrel protein [Algoriphagus sp. TR-M5]WBL44214.1 outer membrane beta-barrel protein [Algoriphagus sp. TR-M9]
MKKSLLTLISAAFFSLPIAYSQSFEVGTNEVSLGLGLGSSLGSFTTSGSLPSINLQYERGMWEAGQNGVISLGGFLGFKHYSIDYAYYGFSSKSSINYTIIGLRSAYHYTGLSDKNWDLYGGAMISYSIANVKYKDSTGSIGDNSAFGSTASFSIYAGARYLFNEKFGTFAELGYGVSFLNLGVSMKF